MTMLDDFVVRAILAGLGIVIAAAPLGCMVVWRRMAYFSDATAHASILGVALALSFSVSVFAGVLIVSLLMAVLITTLNGRGFGMDTMLGVLAHSGLAFGLIAVSLLDGVRVDLMAYLFGDILAVSHFDLAIIWGGAFIVLALLCWRWSRLLTSTLNPDLAYASGIDPKREQLVLTLSLAFVVAIAIKVVGVLLIGAILIIPAATARTFSKTPEMMAGLAAVIGGVGVVSGVGASVTWDVPTGPMIVCLCAILFAVLNSLSWLTTKR
jgi:zinc transport system permease protein